MIPFLHPKIHWPWPFQQMWSTFFGDEPPASTHCLNCYSLSYILWCTHISYMVTNRPTKSVKTLLNRSKCCCTSRLQICFRLAFGKCGTHPAHRFDIPNFLCKIFHTLSSNIPTASATSLTFSRLSCNTCTHIMYFFDSFQCSGGFWLSFTWIIFENFMVAWFSSLSILTKIARRLLQKFV